MAEICFLPFVLLIEGGAPSVLPASDDSLCKPHSKVIEAERSQLRALSQANNPLIACIRS